MATVAVVGLVAAAAMIDQAAGAGTARADSSPPMTVYVDTGSANCLDAATAGTQAVPFCTLQYAANAAVPGQTILASMVAHAQQSLTLTHSGTPTAPITIKYSGTGAKPEIMYRSGTAAPLTFDKVHDIDVSGLNVHGGPTDGIDVIGSQDITLDTMLVGMDAQGTSITPDPASVSVDGASSDITISRSQFNSGRVTYGIRVASGAANVTISTNFMAQLYEGTPVWVTGATGLNLTSNTLKGYCDDAAALTDTSSAIIENNIFITQTASTSCPSAALSGLSVDAATAATAHSDYNYFPYESGSTPVSWAGTPYSDEPGFTAATGQGAHDYVITASQPATIETTPIDSADCAAPGELASGYRGEPRVDDPLVADTGTGTCHADRGAYEWQDEMPFGDAITQSAPTTDGTVTVQLSNAPATSSGAAGWNEPVTYTADWGDGSSVDTIAANGAVTHQYTTAGTYTITLTAADTGGSSNAGKSTVTVYTATAPALTLSASTRSSAGAITADMATFTAALADPADAWELKSAQLNFGQGASDTEPISLSPSSQVTGYYTKPGTYTATLTATDALGRTSTATVTVTVANLIRLMAPVVDYSRTVPANGTVQLWYNTLHLAVDDQGALIDVTVTSATKPGYVTVYASSGGRPNQATAQFTAGQQASNVTLAAVGEFVNFYNGSSAPITLTVTTIGAESPEGSTAGDTYAPVAPAPVLPPFKVAAGRNALAAVAGAHGVPSNAAAVVLDVTASGGTAAGHVTTYPERLPGSQQQGAYWAKGQTVTSLAVVPAGGRAGLHNASSGTVNFSAQVVGYFAANGPGSGAAFVPSARARLLVVTLAGKHSVQVPVTGKNGVLPKAGAVMVNLTTLNAAAPGSLTAWAAGTPQPGVTSLSYTNGQPAVNAAVVGVGADGSIDLSNNGARPVTVVVDLLGSFSSLLVT